MGRLQFDESTIDGLFILGEANFSDHGANRLGASALMQGLADGIFFPNKTRFLGFGEAGKKLCHRFFSLIKVSLD